MGTSHSLNIPIFLKYQLFLHSPFLPFSHPSIAVRSEYMIMMVKRSYTCVIGVLLCVLAYHHHAAVHAAAAAPIDYYYVSNCSTLASDDSYYELSQGIFRNMIPSFFEYYIQLTPTLFIHHTFPTSNQYPISNIQYPISNIQYPISTIHYPLSTIHYPPYTIHHTPSTTSPTMHTLP